MLGPEVRVATKQALLDASPAVAANGRDRIAVAWCRISPPDFDETWSSSLQLSEVRARVFDDAGRPIGPEVLVGEAGRKVSAVDCQAQIAMDAEGGFVVTWNRSLPEEQGAYWVRFVARRFDRDGRPQGAEIQLDPAQHYYFPPQIVMEPSGRFTVAWSGSRHFSGFWLRRFDSLGRPLGEPVDFEPTSPPLGGQVSLAMDPTGRLLVAWELRDTPAPDLHGIVVQLLDAAARPLGEPEVLPSPPGLETRFPAVVALQQGGFRVVWFGGDSGPLLQGTLDAAGHPAGPVVEVASDPLSILEGPLFLAAGSRGEVFVSWRAGLPDFLADGLEIAPDGSGRGPVFRWASKGQWIDGTARPAAVSGGRFVLAWQREYVKDPYGPVLSEVVLRFFRSAPSGAAETTLAFDRASDIPFFGTPMGSEPRFHPGWR